MGSARRGGVASGAGVGGKGGSGARMQGRFVGRGGTSGTRSGGKGGSGTGRGIGFVGGIIGFGRGSWTNTHLATSETAERRVLSSADLYRRMVCHLEERWGPASRLPV